MHSMLVSLVPTALALVLATTGCGAQRQHAQIQHDGEALRAELAELYVARGARHAAAPLLERVIAEAPRAPRARVLYGAVLRDLGLYPQAEKELRFALTLDARRADAHDALAILLDLTGRRDEALRHHARAARLAPSDAEIRNNLGFSLYLADRVDEAIGHLERALALDPSLAQAHINLGFAYGRAGRLTDAERSFRHALSEAGALVNLALVLDERSDPEGAAALRERAYALDPDLRPDPSIALEAP